MTRCSISAALAVLLSGLSATAEGPADTAEQAGARAVVRDYSEPPPAPIALDDPSLASRYDAAIIWLAERRGAAERHRIIGDSAYRDSIREAAILAGTSYGFDPDLLLGIAYRESVFDIGRVGKRGEIGLMQVGSLGRRYCREVCGKNETPEEQMLCGACWLDYGVKFCGGDLRRGLNVYASGKCDARSVGTARAVHWRYRVWRKIRSFLFPPEEQADATEDNTR